MRSYPLGTALVFTASFVDPSTTPPTPASPTNVVFRLLDADGNEIDTTEESSGIVLTNPSTGVFQAVFTPPTPGIWTYRWEGTGAVVAARENQFEIQPSQFQT